MFQSASLRSSAKVTSVLTGLYLLAKAALELNPNDVGISGIYMRLGEGPMGKGRLEAFSDGVIAIIITIMVLEMKVPHGQDLKALLPLVPVFLSYVLSFVYVGIYWNNHHHMLHATGRVHRSHALGQPSSLVLAVALSLRDGVDG
jgi:Endosomal/lysosomal potassium channel TMEM175